MQVIRVIPRPNFHPHPSGWQLLSVSKAKANREFVLSQMETWYICQLSDGVFSGKGHGGHKGKIVAKVSDSDSQLGHVVATLDARQAALVADDKMMDSLGMCWYDADMETAKKFKSEILPQVPKDNVAIRLVDGFYCTPTSTEPSGFISKDLPLGHSIWDEQHVLVHYLPRVCEKKDNGPGNGWHLATCEEARQLQQEIMPSMGAWYIAELVDGVIYGTGHGGPKGKIVSCVPSSDQLGHIILIKNRTGEVIEKQAAQVLKKQDNEKKGKFLSKHRKPKAVIEKQKGPEKEKVSYDSVMAGIDEMDHPQPFIVSDENGKLYMVPKIKEYLETITQPLVVVAIVGIYRSGKSYLLNRLMDVQAGFPLGATVQSKTKGIWMWVKRHPKYPDHALVLLDTEGLSDAEKANKDHDLWIFCLAVLLSSVFVFNSKGTIDNNALHDLHLTANLTEHIRVKSGGQPMTSADFADVFPHFVWAVRDFFLNSEVDGKQLSPNEYLEWALAFKGGHKPGTAEANEIRQSIKEFFPERQCFQFPMPVSDHNMLKELENVPANELNEVFLQVGEKFTDYILNKTELVKQLSGKAVNGSMFIALADCYINAIRDGKVPCLENAITYMANSENTKTKNYAISLYEEQWGKHMASLPLTYNELCTIHSAALAASVEAFLKKAMFDKNQEQSVALAVELETKFNTIMVQNAEISRDKSSRVLEKLYKNVEDNVERGVYIQSGGYATYMSDMEQVEIQYRNEHHLGDEKEKVMNEFLASKVAERKFIMDAEGKLKDEQKRAEELKQQKEAEQRKVAEQQQNIKRMEQEATKRQKDFTDNMEKFKAETLKKTEQEKEEIRKRIESAKNEEARLIRDGFTNQAKNLQNSLNQLRAELAKKDAERAEENRQHEQKIREALSKVPTEIHHHHGGGGCFPGNATLLLNSGDPVSMHQLEIGTKVLSGYDAQNKPNFDAIIGFMDKETSVWANYIRVKTTNGFTLCLSDTHLLATPAKDYEYTFACDLKVNDALVSFNRDGFKEDDAVADISSIVLKGIYCPLTASGTLVVDGILSSCYASFPHNLAHAFLTPVRFFPWLIDNEISQHKDGCRTYVKVCKKIGDLVNKRHMVQ